jgi:hypothetical protein
VGIIPDEPMFSWTRDFALLGAVAATAGLLALAFASWRAGFGKRALAHPAATVVIVVALVLSAVAVCLKHDEQPVPDPTVTPTLLTPEPEVGTPTPQPLVTVTSQQALPATHVPWVHPTATATSTPWPTSTMTATPTARSVVFPPSGDQIVLSTPELQSPAAAGTPGGAPAQLPGHGR